MKYDYTVIQDGQTYLAGEDVPEMGSLICVKKYGNIRDYEGLSKDIDKLKILLLNGMVQQDWRILQEMTL